jgi:5-methylcytosine-specific restriction endonuclease McrA
MSRSWAKGSTTRWRKIRAWVLAANQADNDGKCTLQIPKICTGQATQVHHTKGRAVTGDDPRHLAPACKECNLHVGEPGRTSPEPKRVSRW